MAGRIDTRFSSSSRSSTRGPSRLRDVPSLIISIIASLMLLGGLVGLLFAFDGKPIFDNGVVTLNTVIAIISAANKATILYAVSHAIGQWKWIAFSGREQRRLLDFERIESASRGPLGSLSLMANTHVRRILTIRGGAMLTVLAVAMDPFAQQILQYTTVPARIPDDSGQTAVARATRYSKGTETRLVVTALLLPEGNSTALSGGLSPTTAEADFSMQSAIMYGIVQPLDAVTQQARFSCPQGNCFYPDFPSLSVCSACNDLTATVESVPVPDTSRLNITLDSTNNAAAATRRSIVRYRLPPPSGLYLDNSVSLTMSGTANLSQSASFSSDPRAADGLIWAQTVLRHRSDPAALRGDEAGPVEATECMLYYCVKRYTSAVVNGTLRETSTDLAASRVPSSWSFVQGDRTASPSAIASLTPRRAASIAFHPRFSYPRREDLQFEGGYNVSQAAVDGVSSYFQRTFAACLGGVTANCTRGLEAVAENWTPINGFYMVQAGGDQGAAAENVTQYRPSVAQALWAAPDVGAVFEGIAAGVANALRNGADRTAAGVDDSVGGEVEVMITRYAVDVRWSLVHWFVEVGGIVFVAWTLYKSWGGGPGGRDMPLWGSSTLAVLSRGAQVAEVFDGAATLDEMEARARAVRVVLVDGRIVEAEGAVGLDEFMMVEGEGGKFHVQEQTGLGGHGAPGYDQGQGHVQFIPGSSD